MRVGFDISQIAHQGGVATYTDRLAHQLATSSKIDPVFFYSSLRKSYKGDLKNVKSFRLPPTLFERLFNQLRFIPIEKFLGEVDIFHSSDWVQPPTKAKKVTTYHDVVPLKFPQWSDPKIVNVHRRRLALVEKEIDQVIAVSEATKKDLLEMTKIPEEKITVIYEGVDPQFKPLDQTEIEDFRRRMNLPEDFILAIGGVGERRNLKRVKEAAKGFDLVITGETIPWIKKEEMPLLYNAATLLLYPSFYEGFGLPILEAMACGTPVITSNVSSMPEIGGKAALYVDPMEVGDISKKLKELIDDQQLQKQLQKDGLQRAKEFSWEKCAQQTIDLYIKLLN